VVLEAVDRAAVAPEWWNRVLRASTRVRKLRQEVESLDGFEATEQLVNVRTALDILRTLGGLAHTPNPSPEIIAQQAACFKILYPYERYEASPALRRRKQWNKFNKKLKYMECVYDLCTVVCPTSSPSRACRRPSSRSMVKSRPARE
jgi:hypothetical protein